jgi:hypothetical protein
MASGMASTGFHREPLRAADPNRWDKTLISPFARMPRGPYSAMVLVSERSPSASTAGGNYPMKTVTVSTIGRFGSNRRIFALKHCAFTGHYNLMSTEHQKN